MPRPVPADHPPFAALPVRLLTVGRAREQLAVRVAGRFGGDRLPIICLPGYIRNMTDFAEFATLLARTAGRDWPTVLVDLRGRGRSSDRRRADGYSTLADARDVAELARALAIERAVFVGEGHGGQVLMALAATWPTLIAGAILVDAGPVTAAQNLIRLKSNVQAITGSRGLSGTTIMLRRMLAADYPDLDPEALDRLAARTQAIDDRGQARPLFDTALIDRLKDFSYDDVLMPQWQLFNLLGPAPLMLVRTEFTDQLPLDVRDEMLRRRPDATSLTVVRQGSPALLDGDGEVRAIAEFVARAARPGERQARRA